MSHAYTDSAVSAACDDFPVLDAFTKGYVDCALWSSCDDNGTPLDRNHYLDHIDRDTLAQMARDCQQFQAWHYADIAGREGEAGRDFWLTRNGHGAGFWDGDWDDRDAERLTSNCKAYGEFDLYVGDDGKVYN